MGCWRLADDERLLVEPACGVSVALAYNGLLNTVIPSLNKQSKVVIIVCGGSDITLERLVEYRQKYAATIKETFEHRQQQQQTGQGGVVTDKQTDGQGAVPSNFTAPEMT